MAQKPSIPKGTRDFTPSEVAKRNYIFDVVKKHFQIFGYQPIETPSFENSDTLMGKYGDEGDRLIFKILNSGDYLKNLNNLLSKLFIEFFILSIDRMIESEDPIDSYYIDEFSASKNSKYFLDKISKENFGGNKAPILVDDLFFNCAGLVIRKNKKLISTIVKKHRQIKERLPPIDKEEQILTSISIQAIGYWYSSTTSAYKKHDINFSEKALRYDLTVPFARYVVMHQNELDFPFKRYQIQPVWRADRPQKGRFREFYQCDADVVGSNSLLQEVELVQLYDAVFTELGLKGTRIKLNNRKILAGIAEVIGAKHLLIDFTVALDKLDKIGAEKVKVEMLERGLSENAISKVTPLFALSGGNLEQLAVLEDLLKDSEIGLKGVNELRYIIKTVEELGLQSANLSIDVTLARGLNYYTGAIFEVSAPDGVTMGSIGGGGRYDDLTGIFGLEDVSGVGISFGLDRIYLVLEELQLFPNAIDRSLDVLCLNFGEKEGVVALKLVTALRKAGIKADLYPSNAKIQKQFKYANNRKVPYVILLGEQELNDNSFVVKNMASGEQQTYALDSTQDFIDNL